MLQLAVKQDATPRVCDYDWVLDIREQCVKANKTFWFKNTGSFFRCNGAVEKINPFKQTGLAERAWDRYFRWKKVVLTETAP